MTFAGPGPGGKGQVLAHSVPALTHYRPEAMAKAVTPDLAALVWSGVRQLVWPPLHQAATVGYHRLVQVHVIYMHQDIMGTASHLDATTMQVGRGGGGLGGGWLGAVGRGGRLDFSQ